MGTGTQIMRRRAHHPTKRAAQESAGGEAEACTEREISRVAFVYRAPLSSMIYFLFV